MKLDEKVKGQLKKIAKLMEPKCNNCAEFTGCKSEYRCCDKLFCTITKDHLKILGLHYEETGHPTVPFMGEKGCIIPPEHRPFCTGFACEEIKVDRKFRREYERKHSKIQPFMAELGDGSPDMKRYNIKKFLEEQSQQYGKE